MEDKQGLELLGWVAGDLHAELRYCDYLTVFALFTLKYRYRYRGWAPHQSSDLDHSVSCSLPLPHYSPQLTEIGKERTLLLSATGAL